MNYFNIPDYKYKNYYISGGYAYTVDHYMVHKLFVYKIPRRTSVDNVGIYFSHFDNIISVRFIATDDRNFPSVGFVHFANPAAAARVLNFYHNSIIGRTKALYCVKVCDSWHQPTCILTKRALIEWSYRPENRRRVRSAPPNRDSILVLNDDCLENIMRLMPISSQLLFARSCSRICKVFRQTCKSFYRTLFLERLDNLTKWELRDFFNFSGAYIIRIEGKVSSEIIYLILDNVCAYCFNLKELILDTAEEFIFDFDHFKPLLYKLQKLKILKFSENLQLSGEHLTLFPSSLEDLSIGLCYEVEDEHIISLSRTMRKIRKLDMGGIFNLNFVMGTTIVKYCQTIETLNITMFESDYTLIANLENLKHLTVMISLKSFSSKLFTTYLVKHKTKLLESLRLEGIDLVKDNDAQRIAQLKKLRLLDCSFSYNLTDVGLKHFCDLEYLEELNLKCCKGITNTGLVSLVLKCKNLKRVDVQLCNLISNEGVYVLIKRMKEQIKNKIFLRKNPILIMGGRTGITKDILKNPKYKASSELVIVDFNRA